MSLVFLGQEEEKELKGNKKEEYDEEKLGEKEKGKKETSGKERKKTCMCWFVGRGGEREKEEGEEK